MGGVAQGVVDGQTDCGGYALIISAALRANGIPSRYFHHRFVTQAEFFKVKFLT